MGRLPLNGVPMFRFLPAEVTEMEATAVQVTGNIFPSSDIIDALVAEFNAAPDRAGKVAVQPKQVLTWFHNRRYAPRTKENKTRRSNLQGTSSSSVPPSAQPPALSEPGKDHMVGDPVQFEAKSIRDGAWYDVAAFLSQRNFETSNPEVKVHFSGFGAEADEWVYVRKCVRKRSLPCVGAECAAVDCGDLVLCFQDTNTHALYFDAHVTDIQRRRHDVKGCRCRFLIRYDHDESEEIVPLRKLCCRPETNNRLPILHAALAAADVHAPPEDTNAGPSR